MRLLILIIGLIPYVAFALSYDTELPYTDSAPDLATKVSVGALTEEGILDGNPDGSFRFNKLLNRAEFMKITMLLHQGLQDRSFIDEVINLSCFPDVASEAWFAEPICRAKQYGIVHGNSREGVDPQFWFFEPSRSVQYEEALKVLINIYDIQPDLCIECREEWYEPYIRAAKGRNLDLNLVPGHKLTRGQVSRLVARFVAYEEGTLQELLDAEAGIEKEAEETEEADEAEEMTKNDPMNTDDEESSDSSETSDSSDSSIYDSDPDATRRPNMILLGQDSPALAAVEIFLDAEPLDVTKIIVIFTAASSITSIEAVKVYNENGKYLGRANKDATAGNRHYVLNMKNGSLVIQKQETRHVYVRAIVSGYKSGGVSGEDVEVQGINIEGDGYWSNRSYSQGSSDDFPEHETSQSVVGGVSNAGSAQELLVAGTDIPIGSFKFAGVTSGGTSDLRVTDIVFTLGLGDGVTVSNVEMSTPGSTDRLSCTTAGTSVTCSSIPANFGTFKGSPRTLILYGDVTIPNGAQRPSLQVIISSPGSIGSAGDITWTDGASTFQWVPFSSPVVRGTYYSW
ncbi:MAG: S-layer homology domain-containing protein [Candidatus Peribacteraceae bacterium]|jgi:hypothetical protein|nr:S-layer homology domain-containing protein [Candidatus Peribacteraceae bacterium]HCI04207.1 hypothetical protein [Candidatus Peribacteria bacterium]|tara:strand:+ start:7617 stop:9323 length:1707 start_codon:yes stop_codon:yes gene_type:complete